MRTAEQVRERDKKMTYEEAKAFLADCNQYKGEISLEPLKKMLAILGNPQDQLKFVHVAGTNGKGSTLAYVSTVLKEAGYRVGRYISPTIFSYRERIQVNETYISREGLVRLTEQIQKAGEQMRRCLKQRRHWHFCGLWSRSVILSYWKLVWEDLPMQPM